MGAEELRLEEQYMAQMLAVRPATAVAAAGVLEKAGLIRYTGGNPTIVDRHLEASSCECYEVVRREFERLLRA